jgi:CRP-like cAMP-binding protein
MGKTKRTFNPRTFLSSVGRRRTMLSFRKGETIYAQGGAPDALFVIQTGRVKLSTRAHAKESTVDILRENDFVGEDSVAGQTVRTASAHAMTDCRLLRIEKQAMLRGLRKQVKLANHFWKYVLDRNMKYQQDIVDQHCNSSEKRLAHILLGLAGLDGKGAATIPKISHEILAEMVGTTRSRVSFFMKRFRDSGLIDYGHKGKLLEVHRTLLAFCNSTSIEPMAALGTE